LLLSDFRDRFDALRSGGGASTEIAVVGTMASRAVVQSSGSGYRLGASITQMLQTAVCNRYRSVDQQHCRWLLLSLDRLRSNQLAMTQELIANMLGVRRTGVTEAAGKLHRDGLTDYHRGHSWF
jgi:hypothetical protein